MGSDIFGAVAWIRPSELEALGGSNWKSVPGAGNIWMVPQPVEAWHLRDHSLSS